MEHVSKIIIGANYGDEGKGLVTRHFALQAKKEGRKPITVLHNGTAQRGHTVDYSPDFRHVFHHFGSGTLDQVPTYFADSFLVHPMSFIGEYRELSRSGRMPAIYCDPACVVITPYDMLIDHAIEADIAVKNGEREYGSCGYGSWSTTDRIDMFPQYAYTVRDFLDRERFPQLMEDIWKWVVFRSELFRIDLDSIPFYKKYFAPDSPSRTAMLRHFAADWRFFLEHVTLIGFDGIWNRYDCTLFENGQGLGLDKDVPYEWHTTSKTGLYNPVRLLKGRADHAAEVVYVTRAYLTRHGVGRLEEEVRKKDINAEMHDATNVPNEFQGSLRYGFLEDAEQKQRIEEDWKLAEGCGNFEKSLAITHCNEFRELKGVSRYFSDSPYALRERN
jgi:adenylosuccinate synthase